MQKGKAQRQQRAIERLIAERDGYIRQREAALQQEMTPDKRKARIAAMLTGQIEYVGYRIAECERALTR
jgi:hypothetical protein